MYISVIILLLRIQKTFCYLSDSKNIDFLWFYHINTISKRSLTFQRACIIFPLFLFWQIVWRGRFSQYLSSSLSSSSSSRADSMDSFGSLAIHSYCSLQSLGSLDCIQCPHKADECKSWLVGHHWHVHPLEPTGDVTYDFILTSPIMLRMCCSSFLDGFFFLYEK